MPKSKIHRFPKTRIATIDICSVGLQKHHIAALIEVDVTAGREKIKKYKRERGRISFTAWLIKVISKTIKEYELAASYLEGKCSARIFEDINVSLIVEKEILGQKVPVPLIIEKADKRNVESITEQISEAKDRIVTEKDIVLQRKTSFYERIYYVLPGFARRFFWNYVLKHPKTAYSKMGNVAFTSIGMMGNVTGWFIPVSVHPICFGISTITKKPVVVGDNIQIREILNMTILMDHDVIDGSPMARFLSDISQNIQKGSFIDE
ncbi:2-oxo acid dehydrogenase subunit E2 [candidate division WOR-3 bacterium]|nr:2-oxo acid dehydrogenase subunit E2 [candidate division WOR-3 bacterium]